MRSGDASSRHVARERAPEIAEAARERAGELAEVARERAPEIAEAARERAAELADVARERGPEIAEAARERAEVARERAGDLADTARTQAKQQRAPLELSARSTRIRTVDCRYPPSRSGATMTTDPTPGQYGSDPRSYPPPFPANLRPGGLLARFLARLIDGIIVGVVSMVLFLVTDTLSSYWVTGLFTGLLTFLYFLAFETGQGWTPGKKLLGLRVHGPGGAPKPTAQQSAIRNVWTLSSDRSVRRRPAGFRRDHRDRGDDQQQPDQAGQARRDRGRNPGRQGLTGVR